MKKIYFLLWLALSTMLYLCGCGTTTPPESVSTITGHSIPITTAKNSDLEIYFLDVGQGDATLIKSGDHAMLIDAGDNDQGTAIQLFLKKNGVNKLDYIIGTHPDSDHIGGLDTILTKFDCQTVMLPNVNKDTATYRDVISAMEYKEYTNTVPVVGDTYQLGDAEFTIVAPNGNYGEDYNNWSIGLLLKHGDNKFLFTGDAETDAEQDIISNGIDLSCDVYKAGHHGSNTSSSEALLRAAQPAYAVISCEEGNSYGHPRAETLNNFRAMGIKVFRTDEQGTIVATSDGKEITWDCPPSDTWLAGEPAGSSQPGAMKNNNSVSKKTEAHNRQEGEYILNTKSKKFHNSTCDSLPSDKNRKDSDLSRDEIIEQGYAPCKRCNP